MQRTHRIQVGPPIGVMLLSSGYSPGLGIISNRLGLYSENREERQSQNLSQKGDVKLFFSSLPKH